MVAERSLNVLIVCSDCYNTRVQVIGSHCVLGRSFQLQWKWILVFAAALIQVWPPTCFKNVLIFVISSIPHDQEIEQCGQQVSPHLHFWPNSSSITFLHNTDLLNAWLLQLARWSNKIGIFISCRKNTVITLSLNGQMFSLCPFILFLFKMYELRIYI